MPMCWRSGWESVVDAMTSELRASDYNGALGAALARLETVASDSTRNSSVGRDFPVGWVLLLVVLAAAVAAYEAFKRSNGEYAGRPPIHWSITGRQRHHSRQTM